MGLTLREVSSALGIARNTAGNYCTGKRSDKKDDDGEVIVPKHILLACNAVEQGLPPIK